MKRALMLLAAWTLLLRADALAQRPVVIRNVTVINPGARAIRNATVVTNGSRIADIQPDIKHIPDRAIVVNGQGMFLIPGLWDMHVHTVARGAEDNYNALFIANGVTSIRDMGDDLTALQRARAAARTAGAIAPTLYFGGRIDGPGPRPAYARAATNPAQARAAVNAFARDGVDFIKIPSSLSREAYFAVVAAARQRGLRAVGHVPHGVRMAEAAAAGQASVEHEDDLVAACTSRELEIKRRIADATRTDDPRRIAPVMRALADSMARFADDQACARTARALAKAGTVLVPTFVVYQPYVKRFDARVTGDVRVRYMPASVRAEWLQRIRMFSPADYAAASAFFDMARTNQFHRAGVSVLAGTDTPMPFVIPGFSLHDELELLVKTGLTAPQALAAATILPARFMGVADSVGAIANGQVADMVLLRGDPRRDIRNARQIEAVIVRGRLVDRKEIDRMVQQSARR